MKDWNEFEFILPLVLLVVAVVIAFVVYSSNANQWNDGYCSCGGNWVYQEAVGHRYSTSYIYKCDKCGKIKEFYFEEMQK